MIDKFRRWGSAYLDLLATGTMGFLESTLPRRKVRLEEQAEGDFLLGSQRVDLLGAALPGKVAAQLNGASVTLICRADHFMFRPVEFPARAAPFLGRMLQAQIDRLTPWPAEACAFGWSDVRISDDKLSALLAACPRATLTRLTSPLRLAEAADISIGTRAPNGSEIIVQHSGASARTSERLKLGFAAALAGAGLIAAGSSLYTAWAGAHLEAALADAQHELAALRTGSGEAKANSDPLLVVLDSVKARKNSEPAMVILLEELSKNLPDNSYLTGLHLEGDKIRLIGISADAPALVAALEHSPLLSEAHFYAPTLRSQDDSRDHFQLELTRRSPEGARP